MFWLFKSCKFYFMYLTKQYVIPGKSNLYDYKGSTGYSVLRKVSDLPSISLSLFGNLIINLIPTGSATSFTALGVS